MSVDHLPSGPGGSHVATRPGRAGNAVVSGVAWFDDRGETVNAHGGCVVEHEGRFWLFGEHKRDGENAFHGFACYSSTDLVHWRFERVVLARQPDGLLGPARVGERPKVMRCPSTGLFMLYAHADDLGYTDPHIVVAVSQTIDGEYELRGPLLHRGEPVRRWDIGSFQDDDGSGYLIAHEGDVYRLSDDYTEAADKVATGLAPGGESPAMLRTPEGYHLLFSNKTSWERNDNYYLSAQAVEGPWTYRGLLAPAGTLTHDSQCAFVLRIDEGQGVRHVYMGDRWSPRYQGSAATWVWQPLRTDAGVLSLPSFLPAWDAGSGEAVDLGGQRVEATFASRTPGAAIEVPFEGTGVAVEGAADDRSGFAHVQIVPEGGTEPVTQLLVDHASSAGHEGVRYLSPSLPRGRYTLRVEVRGEHHTWRDKSGRRYGSTDCRVAVTGVRIFDTRHDGDATDEPSGHDPASSAKESTA